MQPRDPADAPTLTPPQSETWLRDGVGALLRQLHLYLATAWRFATEPRTFAASWRAGERRALNPLGFAATSAGIYGFLSGVFAAAWPAADETDTSSLFAQLAVAIGPYVHYALLGMVAHIVLLLLRSRCRAAQSLAIALYAGGSIGTFFGIVALLVARLLVRAQGSGSSLQISGDSPATMLAFLFFLTSYAVLCLMLARGLQGVHRVRGWQAGAALLLAVVVTSLLFGMVLPQAAYGWHPSITISFADGTFQFGVSFGE